MAGQLASEITPQKPQIPPVTTHEQWCVVEEAIANRDITHSITISPKQLSLQTLTYREGSSLFRSFIWSGTTDVIELEHPRWNLSTCVCVYVIER